MPAEQRSEGKICRVCGEDCSTRPRTKDRAGHYYCTPCYEQARRRKAARAAGKTDPPPRPKTPAGDSSLNLLTAIAEQEATASALPIEPVSCKGCGVPVQRGTVICTRCGYNLTTGQRVSAAIPKRARGTSGGVGNISAVLTKPWFAFVGPLVVFGILFAAAWTDEELASLYLIPQTLFCSVIGIAVLVQAFRNSVGRGLLSLCVPFYQIYFVFSVNDSPHLKAFYGVAILVTIGSLAFGGPGMPSGY
ncbi:MAG: hypothetical protein KAV82_03845 [Phycisphaerae bacterium]|nr:hypothetical protein [Phycisphaerae bacterium]